MIAMRWKLSLFAGALLTAGHSILLAQMGEHASYYAVSAGIAAQPELSGVRSVLGGSVDLGVGRTVSAHGALEARIGGQYFSAGDRYISPAACFDETVPCRLPQPSAVKVLTIAGDYVISGSRNGAGPALIAGVGYRYVDESPEVPSELRPFAEVGASVARSLGSKTVGLQGRFQFATASPDLPRWTIPIGINVRFF